MICAPIKKRSKKTIIRNLEEAQKIVDVIEIWFDEINSLDNDFIKKVFSLKTKPFIYKSYSNLKNIKKILSNKVEFVDLDVNCRIKTIKTIKSLSPKTQIILSFHDFNKTPSTSILKKIVKKMQSKKADIIKLSTYAVTFSDSLRILALLEELKRKNIKAICLCMGKHGQLTRTAGHLFGNYLMYAPIRTSDKTADGQIKAGELIDTKRRHEAKRSVPIK